MPLCAFSSSHAATRASGALQWIVISFTLHGILRLVVGCEWHPMALLAEYREAFVGAVGHLLERVDPAGLAGLPASALGPVLLGWAGVFAGPVWWRPRSAL